jgi:hypothetical protein
MMLHASRRVLVLRVGLASCAIRASDLLAIDHDGPSARVTVDGPIRNLSDHLPKHVSDSASHVRLIVDVDGERYGFRTNAEIELVESVAFYRIPRLVREAGCAPWLLGFVLVDHEQHLQPTLWIDLASLATAQETKS